MLEEFLHNFSHNLFKPLLLFFYAGFAIPLLRVKFEFPKPLYQSLTLYLLLAIGWHGGEELAGLPPEMYAQAAGFMVLGFVINLIFGFVAYGLLRGFTRLRKVDAATVGGYYGSDSAGTFVTCLGVLAAANIAYAPYMPVMLAIMEIPGCLVALLLIARLRRSGMDREGNMPGEPDYMSDAMRQVQDLRRATSRHRVNGDEDELNSDRVTTQEEGELVGAGAGAESRQGVVYHQSGSTSTRGNGPSHSFNPNGYQGNGDLGNGDPGDDEEARAEAESDEDELSLQDPKHTDPQAAHSKQSVFSPALLHEVFFNPGIFLLFAGIAIGFISRIQGVKVIAANDQLFVDLFQGILCLFLLEMGITASRKLKDLRAGGWQFIAFGLLVPNLFAMTGMLAAHGYSLATGVPLELGTYALFAVLCGASSYIAVPAVQRLAIPEASPTLPLAASLGLTFSYNVTIGIPLYMMFAEMLIG